MLVTGKFCFHRKEVTLFKLINIGYFIYKDQIFIFKKFKFLALQMHAEIVSMCLKITEN